MKGIIDRFEENYVVVELQDRTIINIEKSKVPSNAKEGDVLNIDKDIIRIDKDETEKLKYDIDEMTKDLWEN
ncbi:preprotein translocase subunit YajC [Clostridium tetanomorphum]|uniref:DUF3006 domain-containing protein n=1 Tax=Clostridium tetanomorphum TaxID=1553 RepID=A0A923EDV2_CLOTT|nr:DUF3006 domain-containing protein [Clostridium tetanomorphum]KAJ49006.1 hypothetical protein CTM_25424 [Clostridium tetanomorphum DSM 665]KAJ49540.1 hypothetical protein CTM_22601 [Clostridium tetanomorphum DSM 665]MBC2398945.1 DUF3006 domain-containing protein [Clostridium tetanomorphum]MBP1866359.1 preprotein translocase subunit YajC [Clostridium tetanomorphum]NRS86536.1 preprotein translocase subunit YajC [Clostridium tetanomorphum]